ncbi:hypothetical protein TEA_002464 [Camellia sinensis var. sinensis]|uniref:CAP-Gly domain-containing linker protein 1-like n=1 Tax=Camellia sinensis var. sinensis TaxID=542762 RepID=A0A4V3WK92_CAMSN|nr:hypothetical protein TEA_002464 [Camellia sinensis var. sinensis]
MANSDSAPSVPPPAPLSSVIHFSLSLYVEIWKKENITPINSKIAELSESRQELLGRIQGLKQDLQGWRSKLDTQVKVYRDELSELKKSLNVEVDQLRSEFQELRTTLQQQQEDVTASLRNLGDVPGEVKEAEGAKVKSNDEKVQDLPKDDNIKDTEQ